MKLELTVSGKKINLAASVTNGFVALRPGQMKRVKKAANYEIEALANITANGQKVQVHQIP